MIRFDRGAKKRELLALANRTRKVISELRFGNEERAANWASVAAHWLEDTARLLETHIAARRRAPKKEESHEQARV